MTEGSSLERHVRNLRPHLTNYQHQHQQKDDRRTSYTHQAVSATNPAPPYLPYTHTHERHLPRNTTRTHTVVGMVSATHKSIGLRRTRTRSRGNAENLRRRTTPNRALRKRIHPKTIKNKAAARGEEKRRACLTTWLLTSTEGPATRKKDCLKQRVQTQTFLRLAISMSLIWLASSNLGSNHLPRIRLDRIGKEAVATHGRSVCHAVCAVRVAPVVEREEHHQVQHDHVKKHEVPGRWGGGGGVAWNSSQTEGGRGRMSLLLAFK